MLNIIILIKSHYTNRKQCHNGPETIRNIHTRTIFHVSLKDTNVIDNIHHKMYYILSNIIEDNKTFYIHKNEYMDMNTNALINVPVNNLKTGYKKYFLVLSYNLISVVPKCSSKNNTIGYIVLINFSNFFYFNIIYYYHIQYLINEGSDVISSNLNHSSNFKYV